MLETRTKSEAQPLTYEQEVHALLCAAASNTESLLQYFEAQAKSESGQAKKLTQKCIDWKRDDLRRIRALIPQALERRDRTTFRLPDELMDGVVKVERPSDLRNRIGLFMLEEYGCTIGVKIDPGIVQSMIEEFVKREIKEKSQ